MKKTRNSPRTSKKLTHKRIFRKAASFMKKTRRTRNKNIIPAKLRDLRNTIPANRSDEIAKTDQLFQQTAEYIISLQFQVSILKRLVEFYGSGCDQNHQMHNNDSLS